MCWPQLNTIIRLKICSFKDILSSLIMPVTLNLIRTLDL